MKMIHSNSSKRVISPNNFIFSYLISRQNHSFLLKLSNKRIKNIFYSFFVHPFPFLGLLLLFVCLWWLWVIRALNLFCKVSIRKYKGWWVQPCNDMKQIHLELKFQTFGFKEWLLVGVRKYHFLCIYK